MTHNCFWHSGLVSSSAYALDLVIAVVTVVGAAAVGWRLVGASRHLLSPYRPGVAARLARWWAARRFPPLLADPDGAALRPDETVRLAGVVESREARPAELSGMASVVCKHAFGERGGGAAGEGLWACDFSLRLADGTCIRVLAGAAARAHRLTCVDQRPHRWHSGRPPDGWLYESRIAPGDRIEVAGRLRRQIDPSVSRASDRSPALGWTLGGPGDHLLCCFTTAPAASADPALPPARAPVPRLPTLSAG